MARKRIHFTVLRQFIAGVALTLVNLAGASLTLAALGGRGEWSTWQFVGLFGLFEWATGLAIVLGPNAWQLPVRGAAEGGIPLLEARSLFRPHWAPGVKAFSGFVLMCAAAAVEGVGVATLGIPLLALFILSAAMGLSLLFARFGAARPDLDVFGIVIRRPGHPDRELPGISVGALVVQLLLNIMTIPTVKGFSPSFLYQPELGPSLAALGWTGAIAATLTGLALLAWRGNLCWRAAALHERSAEGRPARARA
jgi:hypothetical protein